MVIWKSLPWWQWNSTSSLFVLCLYLLPWCFPDFLIYYKILKEENGEAERASLAQIPTHRANHHQLCEWTSFVCLIHVWFPSMKSCDHVIHGFGKNILFFSRLPLLHSFINCDFNELVIYLSFCMRMCMGYAHVFWHVCGSMCMGGAVVWPCMHACVSPWRPENWCWVSSLVFLCFIDWRSPSGPEVHHLG